MISSVRLAGLAIKLLMREWHAGALRVMLAALLIAIISHTSIGFFTERLNRAMTNKAAHLMGGDLVLTSPTAFTPALLEKAHAYGLNYATTVQFSTVVLFADEIQLSAVKAVSSQYPLTGFLKTAKEPFGNEELTSQPPAAGTIWVEQRLLNALSAAVGDQLTLGDIDLTIERILTHEPDQGGVFSTIAPRIMMHLGDMDKANIIQPGSRVEYRYLMTGDPQQVAAYKQWLQPRLLASQKILGIQGEQPTVSTALVRAEKYMGLSGLVAILLAAVAIAMSAKHYTESQFDPSALIRCIGLRQNQLFFIYCVQLSCLALLAALLGAAIGWVVQELITQILIDILPSPFPAPTAKTVISGLALSFTVLFGFSLPTLLRLRRVSPLRVLRKHLEPMPLAGKIIYSFTTLLIAGLIFSYTRDTTLTLATLIGSTALGLFGFALVSALFYLLNRISNRLPSSLKAGLRNLTRRQAESRWQTLAFGTTLMAMALVMMIRTDLLTTWQNQLPQNAPNHFVLNILPVQVNAFNQFLQERDIPSNQLYPISRGRLTHINSIPVKQAVSQEAANSAALNRELSLTEASQLPADNKIVQGEWWHGHKEAAVDASTTTQSAKVSVESQLAKRLGVELGHELTFTIGGQQLNAVVSSIRSVKWDSFNPNFYMMFEPGAFKNLPTTYLTSFYLPPKNRDQLKALVKQFPAVTLLDVESLLQQVRDILTQVTLAIEMVLLLVLAAGFAVTFAALQASLNQRFQEGALMRTLGASRHQIRLNQWVEFISLGAVSGLMAAAGTDTILWACYTRLFHLPFSWHPELWFGLPLIGGILVGFLGFLSSRRVVAKSPMLVLREL